jgi:hypothetical protein
MEAEVLPVAPVLQLRLTASLGRTISRLIADAGGRIAAEYPASGGTAVKLTLPIAPMELSNVA